MFNRYLNFMCIIILVGCFSPIARATEYYCHVKTVNANNSVRINGFPIGAFENPVSGSLVHTQCVTNLIVNGVNRIDVIYSPTAHSDSTASLRCVITTSPDSLEAFSDKAKPFVTSTMASRELSFFEMTPTDFAPSQGMVNENHQLVFVSHGTSVTWGGRLRRPLMFTRVPSRFRYDNLADTLTNVRIRFMKSGTPISVTYDNLTLAKGNQSIDLQPSMISQGAQWMGETGFDEIWIEGQTAIPINKDEELTLDGVTLYEIQGVIKESKTFQITQTQHWRWQDGDRFTSLSDMDKEGIWKAVQTFATALAQKDMPKLDVLLQEKSKVIAVLTHWSQAQVDASRHVAFNATFENMDPAPPPLMKNDIRYILVNPQVVTVKTFAGDDVVAGHSTVSGKLPYSYPLYYAHIGGKWVIIW